MAGFIAATGTRTVCGMLSGAGLSTWWSHDRAYGFFARRRCDPKRLGLALALLMVELLTGQDDNVLVAVDDTLFRRRRPNFWAASWFHDGSAPEAHTRVYGNNWVIVAIVVSLPLMTRPVALSILVGLVKSKGSRSA